MTEGTAIVRAERQRVFFPGILSGVLMVTTTLVMTEHPAAAQDWQERLQQIERGGAAGWSHGQLAQATGERNFNIPPQPLSDALTVFGQQAGLQVSVDALLVRGIASPGVQGSLSPQQALGRLLSGTGFTYSIAGGNTVTLRKLAPGETADGAIQLDPVLVEGQDTSSQGLIGNLPPAYAGGQVARGGRIGVLGNADFMDTLFAIVAFTDQFKEDIQALSVSDVVRYLPSVQASQVGSNTNTDAMYVRGFWGGTSYSTYDGLYGLSFRQPSLEPIERVEMLLGASSFVYGQPYSVGGAINLVPKRAGDEPLTRVGVKYISQGILGTSIDVGRRFGRDKAVGIRVNGAYSDGETEISDANRQMDVLSLAADYRGDGLRWTFDFVNHNREVPAEAWFGVDPGVPVPNAKDASREFAQKWPFYEANYKLAMSRAEFDLSDKWTISAAYGRTWQNYKREANAYFVTDAAGTLQTGWANTELGESEAYSGEGMLRGEFSTGPLLHRLRLGVAEFGDDGRGGWIDTPGVAQTSNIYSPVYYPRPNLVMATLSPKKDRDSTMTSLFIGDQISLLEDRLQFIVGVRRIHYESNWYDGTTGVRGGGYEEEALTPAFGVLVKPLPWLSFYANRVEAMEPGYAISAPALNAGEMLPPARSKQVEVGAKFDFGRYALTTALFEIEKPYAYLDPVTNIEGYNGNQVNRGIEFTLFGELVPGLRTFGGLSLIDATLKDTPNGLTDGNRPSGVSDYNMTAHLDWDVPGMRGLALQFGVVHAGASYNDSGNTQKIDSWTRIDAGARYRTQVAGQDVVVRLNVDNILDEKYFFSERGTVYFAPGRTVLLSATADF